MPLFDEAVVEDIKSLDVTRCEKTLEQGDLILKLIPLGRRGQPNGGKEALLALSLATGIDATTLRDRRYVSSRVPNALRNAFATWSAYHEVARVTDDNEREALLARMMEPNPETESRRWTVDAVREALDRPPRDHSQRRRPEEGSLEERLALYKKLQRDQEVMDAISRALLEAGRETAEQKLQRERDAARKEARDFKASQQALEKSLKEMAARLAKLEQAEGGVEAHDDAETDERGEIVAGSEERVKAALEADVAFKYREYAGNLENFTGRNDPEEVAVALLASNLPVHPDSYTVQARKLGAWLDGLEGALRSTPRVRLVPQQGAS